MISRSNYVLIDEAILFFGRGHFHVLTLVCLVSVVAVGRWAVVTSARVSHQLIHFDCLIMNAFQRLRLVRDSFCFRPLFGPDLLGSDEDPTGELTIRRPIETYAHFFGRRGEETFLFYDTNLLHRNRIEALTDENRPFHC